MKSEPSSQGMTWALSVIGAILTVAIQEEPSGFFLGALLGYLLAQVIHLRAWVRTLHGEIHAPRRETTARTNAQPPSTRPLDPTTASSPTPAAARTETNASTAQRAEEIQPRPAAPARSAVPSRREPLRSDQPSIAVPAEPPPLVKLIDSALAWLKGGNPLARAGIVILFFGATFLAKYAADNSLFPIELRFTALALGACALLIVGWRLREKRAGYAQLLQGGGIAGLYLTVFAAIKLYQLLPAGMAFAFMVAIALASAVLAVAQNSLALAVIGTAGGFLAPILVSTGSGNHVALFTYYAVLNVGIFVVAWFRTWRVLNVLGFFFTFSVTAAWRATGYESSDLMSADAFLILFFLMYMAVSVLNCVRQPPNLKGYVSGSLVFGLPIVAFGLHASLVARIEYAIAWSALALGAFYLLLGWTLLRTARDTFRLLVESFAALGVIFASLAIPVAFDAQTTAAMWALEGAGLVWLGVRQQRKLPRAFGTLLQLGAALGFLLVIEELRPDRFLLNSAYVGTLMLSLSALASSFWLHRDRENLAGYERGGALIFALWGVAWWLCGGLYQIDRFLELSVLGSALFYASLSTGALAAIGYRRDWTPAVLISWWLPALSGLLALVYATTLVHPFAEYGAVGWGALLAAQYGLLYAADRLDGYPATAKEVLHAGACWLVVLLIAMETSWYLSVQVGGVWSALPWGLAPALALGIFSRSRPWPEWPVARHLQSYRSTAAVPIAIATGLWVVGVNLGNRGDPVWRSYLPLLNPLDVSVALCLVCLAVWWTALDSARRVALSTDPRAVYIVFAGMVFLWLNAALIRALHYTLGAPLTLHGIANSTLVQASLSIFWGVLGFAAMTLAARRKLRWVWIAGSLMMGVVVLKLFLVDLSSSGTVARIASFLSVGALLLVTGYLAPLPPKQSEQAAASAV